MKNTVTGILAMLKNFLVNEVKMLFGCTEDTFRAVSKKTLFYLGIYGSVMLLTLGIAAFFTSQHAFLLGAIFSFLLGVEIFILSIVLGFSAFLISMYYGAYFACKGWKRY